MTVQTIQPFQPGELALASIPTELPDGVQQIVAWAGALNAAASLADRLIDTPFIPVSFWPLPNGVQIRDFPNPRIKHPRESVEEHALRRHQAAASASAAVLYGGQLGLDPLVAWASIYVVRGRPGLYAEAMVALVKSHGHDIVMEELTDSRCVIRGRRKGEADWQRFEFSMTRARQAGYVKQNAKYTDDPQSMLYARCASIACRTIAPDVLKGIPSVEEIADEQDENGAEPRTRTVKRAIPALPASAPQATRQPAPAPSPQPAAAVPAGLPPLPGEDEPADTAPTVMLDASQWRAINARFVDLGVRGDGQQAQRLAVISAIVDREISRGGQLTAAEGQLVLDNLAGEAGARVVAVALGLEPEGEQQEAAADESDVEDPPGWDEMSSDEQLGEDA